MDVKKIIEDKQRWSVQVRSMMWPTEKKNAQSKRWELCFIWWAKMRTWSPRVSLWDISERLLRRDKIEATVRPDGWNIKRLLLINDLKVMNLALFYVWESADSGLIEVIPLKCTSAICSQYAVLSPPEAPQVHLQGAWQQRLIAWWKASCFYPELPQGSHSGDSCNVMAWWLQHLFTEVASNSFSLTLFHFGCNESNSLCYPSLWPLYQLIINEEHSIQGLK